MIRVNAVVRIMMAGASDRTVIRNRICSVVAISSGLLALPISRETLGSGRAFSWAEAGIAAQSTRAAAARISVRRIMNASAASERCGRGHPRFHRGARGEI